MSKARALITELQAELSRIPRSGIEAEIQAAAAALKALDSALADRDTHQATSSRARRTEQFLRLSEPRVLALSTPPLPLMPTAGAAATRREELLSRCATIRPGWRERFLKLSDEDLQGFLDGMEGRGCPAVTGHGSLTSSQPATESAKGVQLTEQDMAAIAAARAKGLTLSEEQVLKTKREMHKRGELLFNG